MSISVIIINYYTKDCNANLNHLIKHFNDPLFKVSLLRVNHDQYKKNKEYDHFLQALMLANEQKFDHYLIIKDNSVCLTTNLAKKISKALKTPFDIYFLASYQDACHLYQPVKDNKNLRVTLDCGAVQAFLLSSTLATTLLNDVKEKKKRLSVILKNKVKSIKAATFYPPLISFDFALATNNEDYQLLNLCVDIDQNKEEKDDTVIIVWIIIISLLILFLVMLVPYFKYYN